LEKLDFKVLPQAVSVKVIPVPKKEVRILEISESS
jgi:hypothetical protein